MPKLKVFLSFDYDNDKGFKNSFVAQAKRPDLQFSMNDVSIKVNDTEWQQTARRAIEGCDRFLGLLGDNTHQALGVLREVRMAHGLDKPKYQIRYQKSSPTPVPNGGEVLPWTKKNLVRILGR